MQAIERTGGILGGTTYAIERSLIVVGNPFVPRLTSFEPRFSRAERVQMRFTVTTDKTGIADDGEITLLEAILLTTRGIQNPEILNAPGDPRLRLVDHDPREFLGRNDDDPDKIPFVPRDIDALTDNGLNAINNAFGVRTDETDPRRLAYFWDGEQNSGIITFADHLAGSTFRLEEPIPGATDSC